MTGRRPHIHVETSSRDCDGPLYTYQTIAANRRDWERAIFCGKSLRPEDVARAMAERYAAPTLMGSYERTLEIREPELGDVVVSVSWTDQHEEGFHSVTITACVDSMCRDGSYRRDAYAEAMGY